MSVLLLLFLAECFFWHRKKRKLAGLLFNAVTGMAALLPASFLLAQAGVLLPVNLITGLSAAVLGAPGVLLLSGVVFFGA